MVHARRKVSQLWRRRHVHDRSGRPHGVREVGLVAGDLGGEAFDRVGGQPDLDFDRGAATGAEGKGEPPVRITPALVAAHSACRGPYKSPVEWRAAWVESRAVEGQFAR